MKKIFAVSMLLIGLTLPGVVHATCTVTGEVVRVSQFPTSSQAYLRISALASFYYTGIATDTDVMDALRSCESSRHRCSLVGNASACPTTGTARAIGTISTVVQNP